jgi:hypothetical protein
MNKLGDENVSLLVMIRKSSFLAGPVVVGFSFLTMVACETNETVTGPMRDEPVTISVGSADRANVELNMSAGDMIVRGGAAQLLEGRFEYNVAGGRPQVTSSTGGSSAMVTIREPEHLRLGGRGRYLWDLELNDKVLLDLRVNCGAGKVRLELGELDLRNVEMNMGAGEVDLDLQGTPTRDYDVHIAGGVGRATVRLPRNVGVWAEARGGLGSIQVTGLDKQGDHYQNTLYDTAKVKVRLQVEGGIGEIRIVG